MIHRSLIPCFIAIALLARPPTVLGSPKTPSLTRLRKAAADRRDLADEILCDGFAVYNRQYEDRSDELVLCCIQESYSYDIDASPEWIDLYIIDVIEDKVHLSLPAGAVLMDNGHINLNGEEIQVQVKNPTNDRRGLSHNEGHTLGTRSALVVRVMANGTDNNYTESELSDAAFDVSVSLASQYFDCSYGKLNFVKAGDRKLTGTNNGDETDISNGVTTVRVPSPVTNSDTNLQNEITAALEENFGVILPPLYTGSDTTELADHILYCYPPGVIPDYGAAYAYLDAWLSVYLSPWCTPYTVLMHEIGHNLGLSHSREEDDQLQADQTGVMGFATGEPKLCFNAAKSWELLWYNDRATTLSYYGVKAYQGRLYGIARYGTTASNDIVLIKLDVSGLERDIFIAYNDARGINSGTQDAINKVTVVAQRIEPGAYDDSWLLAKLSCSQQGCERFAIRDFDENEGIDATVVVTDINIDKGYADVEVCIGPKPAVDDLLLVDEETNRVGSSILSVSSIGSYGGFNVKAQVSNPESVLYVKFTKGGVDYQTESQAPYALCGDDDGNYKPCPYTCNERWDIVATPYYIDCFGKIVAGTPLSADFVVECISSPPTPSPTIDQARFNTKVVGFEAINADTNEPMELIGFDAVVPGLNGVPLGYIGHGLNFQVILDGNAGSVVTWLDGVRRTENVHPYALCGDWGGNFFRCPDLCGEVELKAKVCSLRYGRGECSDIVSASVIVECAPPTAGPTPSGLV